MQRTEKEVETLNSKGLDPKLPFGDINVLVLTDVHSWVSGHGRQEPELDADFGDILSFYERLKEHCDTMEMDLWFVSNGDWAHGTGLGGPGDPSAIIPILERMPFDAVSCGNHELYENEKVAAMTRPGGFVDWLGDRYLTANLRLANSEDGAGLGRRYKLLKGDYSSVLTFGFLYNMPDACDLIEVVDVENVVQEQWFLDALHDEEYDAIMILAHMDLKDPLVTVIREAIRANVGPDIPIQFITGHTHYRGVTKLDNASTSFEAGHYLDTLGFVSFPRKEPLISWSNDTTDEFESEFIDANRKTLAKKLSIPDDRLQTPNGKALTDFISTTKEKLGLLDEIGCAPMDFSMDSSMPLDSKHSLYGLYRDHVVPKTFFIGERAEGRTSAIIFSTESFRYDLKSHAPLVVDDIWAVSPFNDTLMALGEFSGSEILKLNATINRNSNGHLRFLLVGDVSQNGRYSTYTHDFDVGSIVKELKSNNPDLNINPVPSAYTSTMLWLTFVMEEWPCDGLLGNVPDWFPTPKHVATQLGRDDDGGTEKVITVVWIVIALLLICACCVCCRATLRVLFHGQRNEASELDQLNLNEDGGNDRFYDEAVNWELFDSIRSGETAPPDANLHDKDAVAVFDDDSDELDEEIPVDLLDFTDDDHEML